VKSDIVVAEIQVRKARQQQERLIEEQELRLLGERDSTKRAVALDKVASGLLTKT
jgi:hypothetical protein